MDQEIQPQKRFDLAATKAEADRLARIFETLEPLPATPRSVRENRRVLPGVAQLGRLARGLELFADIAETVEQLQETVNCQAKKAEEFEQTCQELRVDIAMLKSASQSSTSGKRRQSARSSQRIASGRVGKT